jgi:hypothetical protein
MLGATSDLRNARPTLAVPAMPARSSGHHRLRQFHKGSGGNRSNSAEPKSCSRSRICRFSAEDAAMSALAALRMEPCRATLFSAIIAAAFAGIAMFYVIGFAERRLMFWSSGETE